MATLVKRISWDKIKVGDRIRIEEGTDVFEGTVNTLFDNGDILTEGGIEWFAEDHTRVYRLKEDAA